MDSLEINKKHKEQQKKEKAKLKKQGQIEKNKLKRFKIKERQEKRKQKNQYNRNIRKRRKENPTIAKMIAKIRDKWTCQRCGNNKDIHGSHVINEARDHRLSSDPENIKALCYNCHMNRRHKNPVEAGEWFKDKRPGRWESLSAKHIEYQKMGSIEHSWIEGQNIRLKLEYKLISGKERER